ncbi:hypothetical protein [Pedobacter miscanthi]|uniref:DUF4374 domain-containing protein n=1 Tax=Pedobacter miscanthi TaxID=2259170 RepID=A0A366KNK8_9SPHI|nr:hypothetical protein [Pedobacter miscanthi]RBQ02863.1 hypothetical protein DRW42_24760 [Pedobacter miscanthi]
MKKLFLFFSIITACITSAQSQTINLPDVIYSGKQGTMHVQGVVVDQAKGYVYFSFTDKLIKTDLQGKLVGSVSGFAGHLGDLDFGSDGKIYGSLEYKNDAIGKGIKKELGIETENEDGFYIAIFDPSKIVRPNMDAEKEDLLRTVYLKEAVDDYSAKVKSGNTEKPHRFACSGIDGVAFAPEMGSANTTKKYLYVAYGIYGDTTRTDNDHQVILKYDIADWDKYAKALSQGNLHHSGPQKPLDKYFVKTGNTRYGIQNLAYDPFTGNLFAAVYHGNKSWFANYDLFVIDGKKKPVNSIISSDGSQLKIKTLSLLDKGLKDPESGINGWFFGWGATGLCPLGNGLFYISHNEKTADGQQQSTLHQYQWTGDKQNPFTLIK